MPEHQQDVDSEQHTQSNILIEKNPISTPTSTTKIHKTKRHRRKYNKYPPSQETPQVIDNSTTNTLDDTPSIVEETSTPEITVDTTQPSSKEETKETSVAVADMYI